jgi:hypothetical protein
MQIGMLDPLEKGIFHFTMMYEWLNKYHGIKLSLPAYQNLTLKNKSYEEVSQWNGKEVKEMSQYLFGDVTYSLRGGSPAQHLIINHTIECTQALFEFSMYSRYISLNDATLSSLEKALCRFHTFKDVFFLE